MKDEEKSSGCTNLDVKIPLEKFGAKFFGRQLVQTLAGCLFTINGMSNAALNCWCVTSFLYHKKQLPWWVNSADRTSLTSNFPGINNHFLMVVSNGWWTKSLHRKKKSWKSPSIQKWLFGVPGDHEKSIPPILKAFVGWSGFFLRTIQTCRDLVRTVSYTLTDFRDAWKVNALMSWCFRYPAIAGMH